MYVAYGFDAFRVDLQCRTVKVPLIVTILKDVKQTAERPKKESNLKPTRLWENTTAISCFLTVCQVDNQTLNGGTTSRGSSGVLGVWCSYWSCPAGVSLCVCCCSPPADMWYLPPLVCLLFLLLIPLWVLVAQQNPQTREVLRSGWQPVIVAMSISRCVLWSLKPL